MSHETIRLSTELKALFALGTLVIAGCADRAQATRIPQNDGGLGQSVDALTIPSPEAIVGPDGKELLSTNIYCAPRLKLCVALQTKNGVLQDPSILTSSETKSDLPHNQIVMTGDLVELSSKGLGKITLDIDSSGNLVPAEGFANIDPVSKTVDEMDELVASMNLNELGMLSVQKVLDQARANGTKINLIFRQIINTTEDENGQSRLVDMTEKIWIQDGEEGIFDTKRAFAILEDDLIPMEEGNLLKDVKFASMDIVNLDTNKDQIVMNVYPSDWQEEANGWYGSPEYFIVKDNFAAQGERFALINGKLMDGADEIKGLQVGADGKISIMVNGEAVELNEAEVSLSDDDGFSIMGYEDKDGNGDWESVNTSVDIGGGLSIVLGEKVDGGTVIDKFIADPTLTAEQQTDKLNEVDYTDWGFEAGSLVWMQNSEGKIELVRADDHNRIVGWWERSKVTARTGMVWFGPELQNPLEGDSMLFNPGQARIWSTRNGHTSEMNNVRIALTQILEIDVKAFSRERVVGFDADDASIISQDGSRAVYGLFVSTTHDTTEGNGIFFVEKGDLNGNGTGVVRPMVVTGFEVVGPR